MAGYHAALRRLLAEGWSRSATADAVPWPAITTYRSWVSGPDERERFAAIGCNQERAFFAHRVRRVPKAGPDALFLARRMARMRDPNSLWLITLHADGAALEALPREVFEDDNLIWHRQTLGKPGHIAYATVAIGRDTLYCLQMQSDLVQRISRRREFGTRARNRFGGWPNLLFNAVLLFARERHLSRVRSATSDLVLRYTDPTKRSGRELFERTYDRTVQRYEGVRREGDWWTVDLADCRERIIALAPVEEPAAAERTICVFHDVERGLGHTTSDPDMALRLESDGWQNLDRILRAEDDAGIRATHAVVGQLLPEVRDRIEAGGHELAFHSADHTRGAQLERCRGIDYRIRGYRPPQSRVTFELRDRSLVRWNFEWLASSHRALGRSQPALVNRLVKIPIALDDFPVHTGALTFDAWKRTLLDGAAARDVTVVGLHDCYAPHWIEHYPMLLEALGETGTFRRAGDIADRLFLGAAI